MRTLSRHGPSARVTRDDRVFCIHDYGRQKVIYKIPYCRAPRLAYRSVIRPSASREQRYLAYKTKKLILLYEYQIIFNIVSATKWKKLFLISCRNNFCYDNWHGNIFGVQLRPQSQIRLYKVVIYHVTKTRHLNNRQKSSVLVGLCLRVALFQTSCNTTLYNLNWELKMMSNIENISSNKDLVSLIEFANLGGIWEMIQHHVQPALYKPKPI